MKRMRKLELGNDTYKYGYDDGCLVICPYLGKNKVWLSKNLIEWIIKNQKRILKKLKY